MAAAVERSARQKKTVKEEDIIIYGILKKEYEKGEFFGTAGITHDVTDFDNINTELDIILCSLPFGGLITEHQKHLELMENYQQRYHHRRSH